MTLAESMLFEKKGNMEIAFEEHVPDLSQKDLAFMCEALNIQMRDHFAPAWKIESWPVRAVKSVKGLPLGTFWPIAILPEIGAPGAEGFHDFVAGLTYGRVRWSGPEATSTIASHEDLELRLDPRCNRWTSIGGGLRVAVEACDPCQGDSYDVEVTLFGETRKISVSDFLLPSYFKKDGIKPFTRMDTIDENVFKLGLSRNGGGYLITRDKNGKVHNYFGRRVFGLLRKKQPTNFRKHEDALSRHSRRQAGSVGEVVDFSTKEIA